MLWPEKRDKDELLGEKIPGKIDRTTGSSYLRTSYGYLPDALEDLRGFGRFFPWLVDDRDKRIEIGPVPKGTPVGLLANFEPALGERRPSPARPPWKAVAGRFAQDYFRPQETAQDASDEDARKVFVNLVDPLLELSKCPDLVVKRGHYFETDKFAGGEPGLSDRDKRGLIAFLKRL